MYGAAFLPDGRRIITGSADGTARIWDVASGQQVGILSGHPGAVVSGASSPDGSLIVTGCADGTARVWPVTYQQLLRLINDEQIRGNFRQLTEEERVRYRFTETQTGS
ncbi:MAG: hypothetical protein KAX25_00415 [Dehalococcoidia bacterium]|nr:hypothetical protein [Dehalococcoidia bacterium]